MNAGAVAVAELTPLLPVMISTEAAPAAATTRVSGAVGRMEIVLAAGDRIIVGADVDATALTRVLKALARR